MLTINRAKRGVALLLAVMLAISFIPFTAFAANGDISGGPLTFNFADKAAEDQIGTFTSAKDSAIEWITGDGIGHGVGNNAVLKGTHVVNDLDNYTAADNAVRLTLKEPLRAGGVYTVSVWLYVPSVGNEGKGTLTGPGVVLNQDYANGAMKLPSSPGTIAQNTWKQVNIDTPRMLDPLEYIDFRFVVNDKPNHPDVWYISDITITEKSYTAPPDWQLDLPSLKDTYEDYFLVGNVMEPTQIDKESTVQMFNLQYNAVTCENVMKPVKISVSDGVYNFADGDALMEWADDNGLPMHGHTLVWHNQTAAWLVDWLKTATRDEAQVMLEKYITDVAGHYRGQVISWDVVNEAFTNSGASGNWKNGLRTATTSGTDQASQWYGAYARGANTAAGESGADFIYDAFVFTRLADPYATLYFNDFNDEIVNKSQNITDMVVELNNKWLTDSRNTDPDRLLIEGIGLQAHYNSSSLNTTTVETAIKKYISSGAKLSITELDMPNGGGNPTAPSNITTHNNTLNTKYTSLFNIYQKYAANIERVTFWGKADVQSWRAAGLGLPFDNDLQAKPSFTGIINAVGSSPAPAAYTVENMATVGGSVTPAGYLLNGKVKDGDRQTYIIEAEEGYILTNVEVDGVSVGAVNSYTFTNVKENHTISATFKQEGEIDLPAFTVTSDKNLIKKGDYFNVTPAFVESVSTNAAVVTYSFDSSKFEYHGFTAADGVSVVNTVVGDDSITLTLAKPGSYDVTDLGSALFSVKDSADLNNERVSISVSLQFVYKDAEGVKTILETSGSRTFKTINVPGDTNGDGIVDLIDLSNAIDVFGITESSDLWSEAEFLDFNENGEIDVFDISYIAQLIGA